MPKQKLADEIEDLRKRLSEEFQRSKELSNPNIVSLSQALDQKIIMYQKLPKENKKIQVNI